MTRSWALMLALLLLPGTARAEWQVKPFLGVTFGGDTTFVDLDQVAGNAKFAFGVSAALLGEVFGVEADVGRTPGFFSGGEIVGTSSVTTTTGNVIAALPRSMTKYTLRPYAVGGVGVMHVRTSDLAGVFPLSSNLAVVDVGGGATGFFTDRIGISWDVRYFRSVGGTDQHVGLSIGPEQLSFWRTTMALAIRP